MTMRSEAPKLPEEQRLRFKTRLRNVMDKHRLSHTEAALLLDISDTSVHRYVHGESAPSPRLYRHLDIRLEDLEKSDKVRPSKSRRVSSKQPNVLRDEFVDARVQAGLSQAAAAKILSCSQTMLSFYERGGRTLLDPSDIKAFVEMYGQTDSEPDTDTETDKEVVTGKGIDYAAALRAEMRTTIYELAGIEKLEPEKALRLIRHFLEFSISEGVDFVSVVNAFNEKP